MKRYFLLILFVFLFQCTRLSAQASRYDLRFYHQDKKGLFHMYSDTTLVKISDDGSEIKKSTEEKLPIFFSLNGGKIVSGFYTGEVTKIKTEEGKFQIPHGAGSLTESNLVAAITYNGSFYKGVFHGKGKLVTQNFTYEGDFAAGQKNGKGKMLYANPKEEYNGDWSDDKRHGTGTMWYKDISRYSGAWQNDKRHGIGRLEFPPGFELQICEYGHLRAKSLESVWINDSINGEGILTYDEIRPERKLSKQEEQNAINLQKGDYVEEKIIPREGSNKKIIWNGLNPTGEFKVVFTNGNQYNGKITKGKLDGKGELYFKVKGAEEQGYKNGVWENGLFTGKATLPLVPKGYYKGKLVKDQKQGEGEIKYDDGTVYVGNWENDLRAGKGKYTWPSGSYYDGEWKNNQINGFGTKVIKGYSIWKCNWKDEIPSDTGEVTFATGAKYVGGVSGKKDGNIIRYFFHGFGRFYQSFPSEDTSMRNDSSYVGNFKEGLPHGKGRLERNYVNQEDNLIQLIYDGNWVNGLKQGYGKQEMHFMMGFESFDGEWQGGLKHGKGKMFVTGEMTETTYTGTWNNDKMSGYGESYTEFSNPENNAIEKVAYKGQFAEDMKNGQGTEISNEGTYAGEWKDDVINGMGKMIYKNGRIYEGQWAKGLPNGDGTLTLANKSVQKGKFINGEFQRPFVCKQVTIGTEVWMAENLSVSKFRNGEDIPQAKTSQEWAYYAANRQSAWCYYGFNPANEHYGRLYNWYAVDDPRGLAPFGWHVPENHEWNSLKISVGEEFGSKKLKSTAGWLNLRDADGSGTNAVGFNANAFGIYERDENKFDRNGNCTKWWSGNADWQSSGADHATICGFSDMFNGSTHGEAKRNGLYVRLVKNKVQFSHEIGDYYQGGIVIDIWKNNVGEEHGLIMDLVDISGGIQWSNITATEVGIAAQDKNKGLNNSVAMVNQKGHVSSAASLCLNSSNGGKDDWYLPSLTEAQKILKNYNKIQFALSKVSGGKQLEGEFYWLSTEIPVSETNFMTVQNPAWVINPVTRDISSRTKSESHSVRAIRAF
jgi:uncharacterized protein (TIGR02145 family)